MTVRIGLIVGNGLSLDLRVCRPNILDRWNTQSPLNWDLFTPGKPEIPWLESLPNLKRAIAIIRQANPHLTDFDLFERVLNGNAGDEELTFKAEVESRHFLTIAYSHYNKVLDSIDLRGWKWLEWIFEHRKFILTTVSFNYDLLVERLFLECKIPYTREFGNHGRMLLSKPHGSVDNDMGEKIMKGFTPGYPLSNYVNLNDFPIKLLSPSELLVPRLEGLAVLPNERSSYKRFQWVAPGYLEFRKIAPTLTHCIFLGLSYLECDRDEIDSLLYCLAQNTQIIIANPEPPLKFVAAVRSTGRSVVEWNDGPRAITLTER